MCKSLAVFSGAFIGGFFTSNYMDSFKAEYQRLVNDFKTTANSTDDDEKDDEEIEEEEVEEENEENQKEAQNNTEVICTKNKQKDQ